MKSHRETLAAAYPDFMARIDACAKEQRRNDHLDVVPAVEMSAREILCGLFVWESTDEGHEFWHNLFHRTAISC